MRKFQITKKANFYLKNIFTEKLPLQKILVFRPFNIRRKSKQAAVTNLTNGLRVVYSTWRFVSTVNMCQLQHTKSQIEYTMCNLFVMFITAACFLFKAPEKLAS